MIHSRAGLLVLVAIAAVLAVTIALTGGSPRSLDRAVLPGFAAEHVTELDWTAPGEPPIAIVRVAGGWAWKAPPGRADAAAISDVLAALRGARWHRRAAASAAGTPHITLAVLGAPTFTIAIGNSLPGADQTWLVLGRDALLVDGWVARALAPGALALRDRHPLSAAAGARTLALGDLRLTGHPRRLGALWLDPHLVQGLEEAMADLELVSLGPATGALAESDRLVLAADDAHVEAAGSCAGERVFVHATTGDGCVDAAAWRALVADAAVLHGTPASLVDRRPLPVEAPRIVLPDGGTIDRSRRPTLDGKDADPDEVAALVAALSAPAEVVPLPAGASPASIVAGDITLDLYDHVLARRGEPVALRPRPEAWAVIARPSSAYRDPTRWLEDPSTVASITLDGTTYKRGAVIGEWTGATDPSLIEALAAAIAAVRAPSGPAPASIEHRLDVTIAPPVGAPSVHHLEVGHPTAAGCAGRADGTPVVLPLSLCTAVVAAAR